MADHVLLTTDNATTQYQEGTGMIRVALPGIVSFYVSLNAAEDLGRRLQWESSKGMTDMIKKATDGS